jgi:5-methylcytosine-specific restriction endonuclease McrA
MARFLRSRWMRWALRRRESFRCPKCGQPLSRSFHADHIKAFAKGGKTNMHSMQALCPTCNLKKGDSDE